MVIIAVIVLQPKLYEHLGHFRSLLLHLILRICINFRRFPQSLTGVFIPLSVSPPVRVMWSAEQHIMDGITVDFGSLVMPGQRFASVPRGITDVNIWLACWGCDQDGPSPGF